MSTNSAGDAVGAIGALRLPARLRDYRPTCPNCSPEVVLDPSSRPCSFHDCPRLPSELKVTCPVCVYDFSADEGTVRCDHDTCETARRLKANVPTYRAWLRVLAQERAVSTGGRGPYSPEPVD